MMVLINQIKAHMFVYIFTFLRVFTLFTNYLLGLLQVKEMYINCEVGREFD